MSLENLLSCSSLLQSQKGNSKKCLTHDDSTIEKTASGYLKVHTTTRKNVGKGETPGKYEVHGYKLSLGVNDNFEFNVFYDQGSYK